MLQKRVPVIVPLHEVANSASAAVSAEDGSTVTVHENFSTTASHLPPSSPLPLISNVPGVAQPSTLAVLPSISDHLGKPPMRPLRKNKRLRPALPKRDNKRASEESDECISRLKVAKTRDDRARGNRASVNAPNISNEDEAEALLIPPVQVSKLRSKKEERDVSSSGRSESHLSTVCSPASSVLGSNDDVSTEALMKISAAAKQANIVWTKIKGHPYWPAQFVQMSPQIEQLERFRKAARFRRKGDDTCVMYFGTCEVAYVNADKSCISWEDGLKRNMHLSHKSRAVFQRALAEVKAYCQRNTRFPRGWWCEPQCIVLANDFMDNCVGDQLNKKLKDHIARADEELVHWAKLRGFPYWPVQVLPRNMARETYPALKLPPETGVTTTNLPCMFFGTGEVAVVPEKHLAPFGAGLARGYVNASDRQDFMVALGEVWGYLQVPRIWPSGYISKTDWWNYKETKEVDSKALENEDDVRVPHLPHYVHVRKSVWADGVEPPPKPKKSEALCCDCSPNGNDPCCADSSCLNFASHYFCNPLLCKGGAQCVNVNFCKRKSPRMKPFFTADQRGWGLRVEEPVNSGSFVIEYVGEIIDRDILDERLKQTEEQNSNEYYMMDLTNDLLVDAKFKGNLSRFINSSCEPNCQTQKWIDNATGQTHVGIFAVRDIPVGTELTYNYCFEDYGLSGKSRTRSFMCQCGTSSCSMLEPIERKMMKKLIGRRLQVRWDDGWYPGYVELYNLKKKRFRIQYDDGDCEDLVLGLPLEEDDGVAFRLIDEDPNSGEEGKR